MPWWDIFSGRSPQPTVLFPVRIPVEPDELYLNVYLTDAPTRQGPIPCWVYVTEGLLAAGQKEIVFALRIERGESPDNIPTGFIQLARTILRLAKEGRLVDAGGRSQLAPGQFYTEHLLYIPRPDLPQIPLPEPCIGVICVTPDEIRLADACGPTRLLTRLSEVPRYYPCPYWSERKRKSIPAEPVLRNTILGQIPRVHLPGLYVFQEGMAEANESSHLESRLVLDFSRQGIETLAKALEEVPVDTPVALLTGLPPEADACLCWIPGQKEPIALTAGVSPGAGMRLAGCFLAFVPSSEPETRLRVTEDGFSLLLADADWAAIRETITTMQSAFLPLGAISLTIEVD